MKNNSTFEAEIVYLGHKLFVTGYKGEELKTERVYLSGTEIDIFDVIREYDLENIKELVIAELTK